MSEFDVHRRQILTSTDGPRAEGAKGCLIRLTPKLNVPARSRSNSILVIVLTHTPCSYLFKVVGVHMALYSVHYQNKPTFFKI